MQMSLPAIALGLLFAANGLQAQTITLESAPPVVVETVPKAGTDLVDPALAEIRVSFSKDMQATSWSWAMVSKELFPATAGTPHYLDDQRTAVLPVKLEPGRTYAIWVNTQQAGNFKDIAGQAAVPYLLVFKTRD